MGEISDIVNTQWGSKPIKIDITYTKPGGGLGLAGETVFLFSVGASRASGVDSPLFDSSFEGGS